MKTKCYFDSQGNLLNIGEWDYKLVPGRQLAAIADPETGAVIRPAMVLPEQVTNPLPEGAYAEEREVVVTEAGTFLASDYAALRRAEYPPLRDQLDAIWKGGADAEAMKVKVLSVKSKYPKPQ